MLISSIVGSGTRFLQTLLLSVSQAWNTLGSLWSQKFMFEFSAAVRYIVYVYIAAVRYPRQTFFSGSFVTAWNSLHLWSASVRWGTCDCGCVCFRNEEKKTELFILKSPYCLSKLPVRLERIVCLTKCQSNKLNRLPVEEAGVGFFFFLRENLHFTFLQWVEGFVLWALRSRSEIFRWNSSPTFQSIYRRIF